MAVQTFRDDDPGYEAWFAAHPSGWVVNAKRSPSPAYLKLHRADCPRITRLQAGYQRWTTGDYIKVCAEHRAELDAGARQALRAGLQGGCHCVQYRDGARPRTTSRVPTLARAVTTVPAAAAAAAVVDAEGYRTLETAGLISFEPRDATLLDSRAALRAMLGGLSARPGEVLHGIVEGPAVAGTDLDNALLYNVGGSVNAAARYGVVIERRPPRGASTATRYRYRLTNDPDLPALDGESVVELDGVVLSGAPRAWPDIWVAVRTSDAVRISGSAAIGELGLRLRVGAPRFKGAANGQFVKTVIDGVMTALHAHGDRSTAADVADRLAALIPLGAPQIAALLVDDERAALGVCPRLVVLRGQGVQCQPQDGRISALRIDIDRSASSWQLSGQLVRTSGA